MASQSSYQSFIPYNDNEVETPQECGVMIHVVSESGKSRWNHIEDLDSFFTRVYQYHQKHGFSCMMLQEVLELFQFIFVVLFSTFLLQCVNYSVLFKDQKPPGHNGTDGQKISLGDAVIPLGQCASSLSPTIVICLLVALVFWLLRLIKVIYHVFQYLEIRAFYYTALKITSSDLDNMTWHEVQRRLLEVQSEQEMCIHKRDLSELDIYHRILRFKNYMIAMVNKELLPTRFNLPFLGEKIFFTKGLKYNLEMILFWGPWAPFDNNWHLKEDYKMANKRKQLAAELSKHIMWIGLANFVLCPLILLWQVLYSFFNYAEIIKREPGALGARRWSLFGRLYLRHFNELDHELNARFNRGYKAASQYMGIFTSHMLSVIAKNVAFFAGSLLAVLVVLTVIDEDVITVEHVLTTVTVLGVVIAGCRVFIPDEHLVWCPEALMTNILAHIHYIPDHWKGNAHTYRVRAEFAQLFQYKAAYLLEELLSPIVTPFILCCHLSNRALDIVDFYRNFTVDVAGVGDVCSFAQMDVKKHGCPEWMSAKQPDVPLTQQTELGKTELSLMHFTLTNPNWVPPEGASKFLKNLQSQARGDADRLQRGDEENPLYYSLHSLSGLGAGYADLVNSIWRSSQEGRTGFSAPVAPSMGQSFPHTPLGVPGVNAMVRGSIAQTEGPLCTSQAGLLSSLQGGRLSDDSPLLSAVGPEIHQHPSLEFTAANMSLSTLYMHELHSRQLRGPSGTGRDVRTLQSAIWHQPGTTGGRGAGTMPEILESPLEGDESEDRRQEHQPLLLNKRLAKSS